MAFCFCASGVHAGNCISCCHRLQVEDTTQAIFFNTGQACTAVRSSKLSLLHACRHMPASATVTQTCLSGFTCVTVRLQASRTFVHEDVYDKVNSVRRAPGILASALFLLAS